MEYSFRFDENKNKWSVYDVWIKGISFVSNYRSQFGELLLKRSPQELLEMMREKISNLKDKNTQLRIDDKLF